MSKKRKAERKTYIPDPFVHPGILRAIVEKEKQLFLMSLGGQVPEELIEAELALDGAHLILSLKVEMEPPAPSQEGGQEE